VREQEFAQVYPLAARAARARSATAVASARLHSVLGPIEEGHLIGLDGIPALEFRMDLQQVGTPLRASDRQVAILHMDHTPTEASRQLGLSRSTVFHRIRHIRAAFENAGWRQRGRVPR